MEKGGREEGRKGERKKENVKGKQMTEKGRKGKGKDRRRRKGKERSGEGKNKRMRKRDRG